MLRCPWDLASILKPDSVEGERAWSICTHHPSKWGLRVRIPILWNCWLAMSALKWVVQEGLGKQLFLAATLNPFWKIELRSMPLLVWFKWSFAHNMSLLLMKRIQGKQARATTPCLRRSSQSFLIAKLNQHLRFLGELLSSSCSWKDLPCGELSECGEFLAVLRWETLSTSIGQVFQNDLGKEWRRQDNYIRTS